MDATPPRNDHRGHWIAAVLMLALGLFMVLLSLGVIEGRPVSGRRALFNGARHWQLAAFGLAFALAGLSLWIPRRFEALTRFNAMALILALAVAIAGTVWYGGGGSALQKGGSMTAFLDGIANWFQSIGVHPVLGAFMAGAMIAFVFAYRRSPTVDLTAGAPTPVARPAFVAGEVGNAKITVDGRTVEITAEVMAYIRDGNKIAAIKALRSTSGLDLKGAKDAVEAIADSAR